MYEKVVRCYDSIKGKIPFIPKVALVLGSGLGNFTDSLSPLGSIPFTSIENFPISTAPGHRGQFIFAEIAGIPSVIMQGRVHFYEGYSISDVVLPIRLMKLMGSEILFLTNAAGGINKNFSVGDFMMITDHISSFVPSPLIGKNNEAFGLRFPDMSEVYNRQLRDCIRTQADSLDIGLQEGVYIQFTGPAYETPAEIILAEKLGADAVGMSTVVEALAANHMGMKVCGISCISNMAAGISVSPLTAEEVLDTGKKVAPLLQNLVTKSIYAMGAFLA